jgi:hypothetical protein
MRKAFFLAAALVACSTNDAADADSANAAAAGATATVPARLTAADVAGTWTGTSTALDSDSVTNRWTSIRVNDSTSKLVSDNVADTVTFKTVFDADSMVSTSQPYTNRATPNAPVIFRSVGRLQGEKLVGTLTTMLASKPDSIISRGRWEATKKP